MHLIFADENFDLEIVKLLRDYGHDVVTMRQLKLDNVGGLAPYKSDYYTEWLKIRLTKALSLC